LNFLASSLKSVNDNIDLCTNCFLPSQNSLCSICASPKRDKNVTCIIEKETDAMNLEKTGHFKGRYYVLGGFINPLEEESLAHRRLDFFIKKARSRNSTEENEIILALSPRREGDFTSLYIEEKLKPLREQGLKIKITRLGRGLSSGAELEYADDETLKNALEGRR